MSETINCEVSDQFKKNNPTQYNDLLKALAELQDCREKIKEMREWEKDVVERVAELMPNKELSLGGIGYVTRNVSAKNKWDDDAVFNVISAIAKDTRIKKVDEATGEVLAVESEAHAVRRLIEKCAKVSYWRKTDLTEIGVDIDEYCATTWGKPSISIQ